MIKKVSIIIPIYNSKQYIARCVESVLCQTYGEWELVLIDDGSTDGSREICQTYKKTDSRIVLLLQKNNGASSARNVGLRNASGDYVLFVDSDDWIETDLLENMVKKAEFYNVEAVVFGWKCEGIGKGKVHQIVQADTILSGEKIIEKIICDNYIYGGGYTVNKLWSMRTIREQGSVFEESLFAYEDKVFAISNYMSLSRVLLVPDVCYHYVEREESLSHYKTFQWNVAENVLLAHWKIAKVLKEKPNLYEIAIRQYYILAAEFLGSAVKRKNRKYMRKCHDIMAAIPRIAWEHSAISITKKIKYRLIFLYVKYICRCS